MNNKSTPINSTRKAAKALLVIVTSFVVGATDTLLPVLLWLAKFLFMDVIPKIPP